jgi:hypothetical protein
MAQRAADPAPPRPTPPIHALRIGAALLYLALGLLGVAVTAGWVK